MNAPLTALATPGNLAVAMYAIGRDARSASHALALAPAARKNNALADMAKAIRLARLAILDANAEDVAEAKSGGGSTAAFLDRLTLDADRVEAVAAGLEVIRKLKDPVGTGHGSWRRPNGMRIERVRVPLGVVGVIYESRPNVTADAGALCLKAGNAVILRGGSESFRTARAIHTALVEGLVAAELPAAAITLVPTRERAAVGMMLAGLDGAIDVIVPRGGKSSGGPRADRSARAGYSPISKASATSMSTAKPTSPWPNRYRAQRQDAPDRRVRGGRDAARRPGRRAKIAQAARRHAPRRRVRDPRRCRRTGRRSPREARDRSRLGHGIPRLPC